MGCGSVVLGAGKSGRSVITGRRRSVMGKYEEAVAEFAHPNAAYQEAVREYTPVFADPRLALMNECLVAYDTFMQMGYSEEEAFNRACDGEKSGTGCYVYEPCFEHYLIRINRARPRQAPLGRRVTHGGR